MSVPTSPKEQENNSSCANEEPAEIVREPKLKPPRSRPRIQSRAVNMGDVCPRMHTSKYRKEADDSAGCELSGHPLTF